VDSFIGDSLSKAEILVILGVCHRAGFKRLGNLPGIESAIANLQQAIDLTADKSRGMHVASLPRSGKFR
jgi:hypothetical protein